jgi:hypothetical protein
MIEFLRQAGWALEDRDTFVDKKIDESSSRYAGETGSLRSTRATQI